MGDGFAVELDADGVFRVRGARIERIAAQTNFDVEESAERFQRDLARLGIDTELRRAGIAAGDLVRIGGTELEWEAQAWELTLVPAHGRSSLAPLASSGGRSIRSTSPTW